MYSSLTPEEQNLVQVYERFLDGAVTGDQYTTAIRAARRNRESSPVSDAIGLYFGLGDLMLLQAQLRNIAGDVPGPPGSSRDTEERFQTDVMRDIFRNPFQPVTLDPTWLTLTVRQLAALIYEERQFDKLPLLGDSFQDAGCENEDVLRHCRGRKEHFRGCWLVDEVLGRE
jgi:hypothetical protein